MLIKIINPFAIIYFNFNFRKLNYQNYETDYFRKNHFVTIYLEEILEFYIQKFTVKYYLENT